jgi:hypothetical protein
MRFYIIQLIHLIFLSILASLMQAINEIMRSWARDSTRDVAEASTYLLRIYGGHSQALNA